MIGVALMSVWVPLLRSADSRASTGCEHRFLCPFPKRRRDLDLVATGTVKWFSAEKGCGFIVPDGGGTPLFVDHSAIVGTDHKTLAENTKVQYEPEQGEYGPEAKHVTLSTA